MTLLFVVLPQICEKNMRNFTAIYLRQYGLCTVKSLVCQSKYEKKVKKRHNNDRGCFMRNLHCVSEEFIVMR